MPAQGATYARSQPAILTEAGMGALLALLRAEGYAVIGPRLEADAIALGPVERVDDLPAGVRSQQTPGHYRLSSHDGAEMLLHAAPATPWKRFLYLPEERLFRARRSGDDFRIDADEPGGGEPALALLAVCSCDLAGIAVLDAVLADEVRTADRGYRARRERTFVIAADCAYAADTCFCASMGTGPRVSGGFDLVLSEVPAKPGEETAARLLVAAGSEQGAGLLAKLDLAAASGADRAAAEDATAQVAAAMARMMPPDIATVLARNLESPIWDEIAKRCLGCGNCTMVCPTCFCASVEDTTDLDGEVAERRRVWDSCFTLEHSYIHGGGIRTSGAARYRQWMCHKLSFWHGQFGTSGCVGCGRCITWCPVGIDITEEAWRFARAQEEG